MRRARLFLRSICYSFQLLYRSSKWQVVLYFAVNLIYITLPLLSAFILKYLFDSLIAETWHWGRTLGLLGLYVSSLVLAQAFQSAKNMFSQMISQKAAHLYDCDILQKIEVLPMSFVDTSEGRDTLDEVQFIRETAVALFFRITDLFSQLYTFAVAAVTLIQFHIWFSLLFLALTIPGTVFDWVYGRKMIALRHQTAPDRRKFSYYRWMLTDPWPAKDVRMYNLTEPITQRYREEKNQYLQENKKLYKKELYATLFAEVMRRGGEIAFIFYIVLQAIAGTITIGDIALYMGFAISMTASFQAMTSIFVIEYADNTELFETVFRFLDVPCPENRRKQQELTTFESLTFDHVYFKYPQADQYVLSDVSFTLSCGDKLSIVGINGSGKTTIIKLMLGLYEIESGQILINGYPMSDYDIQDVRKLFSVLFQNFVQYPLSLRENVALSSVEKLGNTGEIECALEQSGVLADLLKNENYSLDTMMTRKFDDTGIELSKGQWQKIALSRAYFKNAAITILDEPSAALDAEAEDRIFKNFEAISNNKTGIMISHRISSARLSNKIIVLDGGKIVEAGSHEDLISQNGLYAKLYNLQREKYAVKEA